MRVALNGYFWDQPRTGSGQYLRHLWHALSASYAGAGEVVLLRPGDGASSETPTAPRYRSYPQPLTPGKGGKLGKLLWEQRGVVKAAGRQCADLLHVPYLAAPLVSRVPLVVTAHDMIPWVVPGYAGSPAVRIYLALASAGVKRARLIIADSDASRRDVIRVLRVPPRRVHTVYLGVEPRPGYSAEQLEDVRSRFGLPGAFAFYIGGFDRRKNVPLLLNAWRMALDAIGDACTPVLAVGGTVPPPGGIVPDVRGEASRLGLDEGKVRFLGPVSEEDKYLLMGAARVFVFPSAYEGFGLDPLEAMSVGCPVVSSSGGSLPEVVGDAGLLVRPGDAKALCEAIVRAWSDDALRERLRSLGRERARRFTWQRTAELTLNLYRRALRQD